MVRRAPALLVRGVPAWVRAALLAAGRVDGVAAACSAGAPGGSHRSAAWSAHWLKQVSTLLGRPCSHSTGARLGAGTSAATGCVCCCCCWSPHLGRRRSLLGGGCCGLLRLLLHSLGWGRQLVLGQDPRGGGGLAVDGLQPVRRGAVGGGTRARAPLRAPAPPRRQAGSPQGSSRACHSPSGTCHAVVTGWRTHLSGRPNHVDADGAGHARAPALAAGAGCRRLGLGLGGRLHRRGHGCLDGLHNQAPHGC